MIFLSSLRWKISLFITGLVLGTVLLTGWVINYTLDQRFKSYLLRSHEERIEELLTSLGEAYRREDGWWALINSAVGRQWLLSTPLVRLEDAEGKIVYQRGFMGMMPRRALSNRRIEAFTVTAGGRIIGRAWIMGPNPAGLLTQADLDYQKAVNKAIIFSIILLGLAALALGYWGANTLIKRLRRIEKAVAAVSSGDLKVRVRDDSGDELGTLAGNVNKMADELDHLEELRQKYLSETAHELRTPLTTIRSHIEAFLDGVLPPDKESLARVQEEVLNLISLINDLQDLASSAGLRHNLTIVPIELREFLGNLADKFRPVALENGLRLETELPPSPLYIKADFQALTKIINNLLSNAVKFSSPGGLITLRLAQGRSGVTISVSDQGVGIPPADLPRIFDRFYRVDPSRSRRTGGAGLGLAIVKELTEALGGRVEVESVPGAGSAFTLVFPPAEPR